MGFESNNLTSVSMRPVIQRSPCVSTSTTLSKPSELSHQEVTTRWINWIRCPRSCPCQVTDVVCTRTQLPRFPSAERPCSSVLSPPAPTGWMRTWVPCWNTTAC